MGFCGHTHTVWGFEKITLVQCKMFAVGIDISKSKSVAAILNQDGSMHTSPFEFHHTQPELDAFIKYILNSKQSATILIDLAPTK